MPAKSASRSHGRSWNSAFKSAFAPTKYSLAIVSIAALAGGCYSSNDATVQNQVNNRAANPSNSPFANETSSQSPLVGAWMGKAIVNEKALLAAADSLSGDQRQALIREARTFVTTEMAIQFSPSGEMETAIEIQPVGSQKFSGQTFGTWKIVEATDSQVTVKTSITDSTGATSTGQTSFAVSVDGDRLVLQPEVSSALADCEALIYLDRQAAPAANVARSPEGGVLR